MYTGENSALRAIAAIGGVRRGATFCVEKIKKNPAAELQPADSPRTPPVPIGHTRRQRELDHVYNRDSIYAEKLPRIRLDPDGDAWETWQPVGAKQGNLSAVKEVAASTPHRGRRAVFPAGRTAAIRFRNPRVTAGSPGADCALQRWGDIIEAGGLRLRYHQSWAANGKAQWGRIEDTIMTNAATKSSTHGNKRGGPRPRGRLPIRPHARSPCGARHSRGKADRAGAIFPGWPGTGRLGGPRRNTCRDFAIHMQIEFPPNAMWSLLHRWKAGDEKEAEKSVRGIRRLAQPFGDPQVNADGNPQVLESGQSCR